jgi:hypothetical protein
MLIMQTVKIAPIDAVGEGRESMAGVHRQGGVEAVGGDEGEGDGQGEGEGDEEDLER